MVGLREAFFQVDYSELCCSSSQVSEVNAEREMSCEMETRFKQIQTRLKVVTKETEEVECTITTNFHLFLTPRESIVSTRVFTATIYESGSYEKVEFIQDCKYTYFLAFLNRNLFREMGKCPENK